MRGLEKIGFIRIVRADEAPAAHRNELTKKQLDDFGVCLNCKVDGGCNEKSMFCIYKSNERKRKNELQRRRYKKAKHGER